MSAETAGVGCCGMVCSVCMHGHAGCKGCEAGCGDEACVQRHCCRQRGLIGCWECGEFKCEKGYFGDEAWRGLNLAFVAYAREHGPEALEVAAVRAFGERRDFGEFRHCQPADVRKLLAGDHDNG